MPDTSVVYFDSTMSGAPVLSGTPGALIGVLDAVLINGIGSVTLDSLVVSGDVATGSISTGHNFSMVGNTGPVIEIAGATPAELNGRWRLASVPNATTFTFATIAINNQTATGTITAKRAPAGWAKAFSATNKAAYSRPTLGATAMLLRVDDTGTTSARVRGFEAMTDVDTGAGPFPTDAQFSGGLYQAKSSTANATARAWRVAVDGFWMNVWVDQASAATTAVLSGFGDTASFAWADAYNTLIVGGATTAIANMGSLPLFAATGKYMPRSYTQLGTSINPTAVSHARVGTGFAGMVYPSAESSRFFCAPYEVWEAAAQIRGVVRGLYAPLHIATSLTDGEIITDVLGLPGRDLMVMRCGNGGVNYALAIDITGPW